MQQRILKTKTNCVRMANENKTDLKQLIKAKEEKNEVLKEENKVLKGVISRLRAFIIGKGHTPPE